MNNSNEQGTEEILISTTKDVRDQHPVTTNMEEIVKTIRTDQLLERQTEEHRYLASLGLQKEADAIKSNTLRFFPSGLLEGGTSKKCIKQYNGNGMVDIDDISPEQVKNFMALLSRCPYVHLAYITISGKGIRIIFRTDATDMDQHYAVFSTGNEYFHNHLHCQTKEIDRKCKNVNRLSGLAHDENVIYHPQSDIFHIPSIADLQQKQKEAKTGQRRQRIREQQTGKIGTKVQKMLEIQGKEYVEGSYNEYASSAIFLMNKYGVEEDDTLEWAKITFDDYDLKDLQSIIHSVYTNHTDEYGTMNPNQDGQKKYINIMELEEFVASQADFRYNTITCFNEIRWKNSESFSEMTDQNENSLWSRAMKAGFYCTPANIQTILRSEFVPHFNPITEYLENLPEWDGTTDYIGQVTKRVSTETPELFSEYFRKWFVAMIASMMDPMVVNNCILMFVSEKQGVYKTTFFSKLLPPELQNYYSMKVNMGYVTKDDLFRLSESALICLEEVDSLNAQSLNQLKAMITIPSINERPAYGRNKEHRYHLATFCGTGNNEFFLTDDSGSRRWLNFKILNIVSPYEHPFPYEGMYAQALYLYRNDFCYWFTEKEVDRLQEHNHAFEAINPEEELIGQYFRIPRPGEHGIFMSTTEILEKINLYIKIPLSAVKVAKAMKRLGFRPMHSSQSRGFLVVELTDAEKSLRREMLPMGEKQQDLPF